jgi:hypothetical protein
MKLVKTRCAFMGLSPDRSDTFHAARLAGYSAVSNSLASLSDRQLLTLVDAAPVIGSSIGGTAALLVIEGTPVFVKRVPLTDLERRPENIKSTANMFQLPTCYQYGVGSVGFGVWRELAAHAMTTKWVLGKQCESFALMYHWRVLTGPPPRTPMTEERADLMRTVAYWDSSPAVRERLEAIARSSASVALFLEYIPQNLYKWLTAQVAGGEDAIDSACAVVERGLRTGVSFMNSSGLLHFDAHLMNLLTDGQRLYFADFGLATSSRFELSEAESIFFEANTSHDGCYVVTQLVNWLVTTLSGAPDRDGFIHRCAEGGDPVNVSTSAAGLIERYAPVAVVMNKFYRKLHLESRTTPYPVAEIQRVCDTTGFDPYFR